MKNLKIGIDNYGLHSLGLTPMETLQWAEKNHAQGVQFSGFSSGEAAERDHSYLRSLANYASKKNLYIEWGGAQHIPFDMESWERKDIYSINKNAVQEASVLGTHVVRSCSGGLMRWDQKSTDTESLLYSTAEALKEQRSLWEDFEVTLAVETHFEFTTFELLRLFEMCDVKPGGYLGICLDTMNLLTMLEEPVCAVERILPWVVATHIKDGGITLSQEGLKSFPCEIGKGIIDLKKIISLLSSLPHQVHLSIEDHGGSFIIPVFDKTFMKGFPDVTLNEFVELMRLVERTSSRLDDNELDVIKRDQWPELCEQRMMKDVMALIKIRDDLELD